MPNMYRMIALSAALAMGFFGIFLGKFWDTQVYTALATNAIIPFMVWCALWALPAVVIAAVLVSVLDGPSEMETNDFYILSASLMFAALGGIAAYYGYMHMGNGPLYYASFGIPVFLLPVVWFAICHTECMKAAQEDTHGLLRYKPYRR